MVVAMTEKITARITSYNVCYTKLLRDEDKLAGLDSKLADKVKIAESEYKEKVAALDGDIKVADEYIDKTPVDTSEMEVEAQQAEQMKKHLNEYRRMVEMQSEIEKLTDKSET